jgi:hypothetical protein
LTAAIWSHVWQDLILPSHLLCSEEISRSAFNALIGLVDRERVDAALYDDFESDKAKEVRDSVLLLN